MRSGCRLPILGGPGPLSSICRARRLHACLRAAAEGEGFEPPSHFRGKRFSRPPVSTTHPSLRSLPAQAEVVYHVCDAWNHIHSAVIGGTGWPSAFGERGMLTSKTAGHRPALQPTCRGFTHLRDATLVSGSFRARRPASSPLPLPRAPRTPPRAC